MDAEASPDDSIEADGLDIDALLPVAFDTGSARVVMGQDLADLLRSAEERLDARGEISQPNNEAFDNAADVPVPEDVLALLGEPLESDEEEAGGGTGAIAGSSAGTGADRPATLDGPLATAHGQEDDLEQPLPRASDLPRKPAGKAPEPRGSVTGQSVRSSAPPADYDPGRHETAPGRSDSSLPGPDPGRAVTGHGITAELMVREPQVEAHTPVPHFERATPAPRTPASIDRTQPLERVPPIERPVPAARATPAERAAPGERAVIDRGAALIERAAMMDRGAASVERALGHGPMIDRGAAFVERAAMTDRSGAFAERPAVTDRGNVSVEKAQVKSGERQPHGDGARFQTGKMAAIDVAEPPKSRMARTEAMPAVLGPGDAPRALGRAIANRVSGALVVASGDDQRRIMLHDGDVVTAGSTAPVESLVAFLAARGDLDRDLVPRLAGKLPPFGRHAGAALVANGYLGQDDLWPVLRAHGEWVMGRTLLVESGTCELENDPPARYKAEPGVFGGATGAEVFVDAVQRVIAPENALARLGGFGARLVAGPRTALLSECALSSEDQEAMRAAPGHTVHQFTGDGPTERWSLLYALVCLDVLDALPAVAEPKKKSERAPDPLDDEALRARVRARLALVEEGDYFALLGVARSATSYEIRRAYLDLRRTLEPSKVLTAGTADLADDLRLVVEVIEEAYEILRDGHRRERYRRAIEAGPPR